MPDSYFARMCANGQTTRWLAFNKTQLCYCQHIIHFEFSDHLHKIMHVMAYFLAFFSFQISESSCDWWKCRHSFQVQNNFAKLISGNKTIIKRLINNTKPLIGPIPVAERSKASVYDRSLAGIAVSNPARAWMSVCWECCVLSGRGLCDGLITRPEESYRLWCVIVCDLQTSKN